MKTMQKARALALVSLCLACISSSPAWSQGMMEGTFVRGLGAGMGAGTAASMSKGKTVRRTYEQMLQAQQAVLAQTKAIEQYVATGAQMIAKRRWATAEQYYQSALQLIAKRDGPGSAKSAPVLEKLAKVSKEQNKLDQAIGYQKTVVAFANRDAKLNPSAAVQAQTDLSAMYVDKGDYTNAEGVLRQSTEIARRDKAIISPTTYTSTLKVYGVVLRKLNKTEEAESIEAELAQQAPSAAPPAGVVSTVVEHSHAPTHPAHTAASPPNAVHGHSNSNSAGNAAASAAEASTVSSAVKVETSGGAESQVTSATGSGATAPGALLPPPTADWPVIGSDGKIGSDADASQPQTALEAPQSTNAEPAVSSAAPASPPAPAATADPAATPAPAATADPAATSATAVSDVSPASSDSSAASVESNTGSSTSDSDAAEPASVKQTPAVSPETSASPAQ